MRAVERGKRAWGDLTDEDILRNLKRQKTANDNQFSDEEAITKKTTSIRIKRIETSYRIS